MYITLDLETTGFDPKEANIIEVGAALFDETGIVKKFSKLINPLHPIPDLITHITNICDEDVKDAPTFDQIADELQEFLGNYPIIGHNISFDTGFLKAKGLKLSNPEYDTFALSTLVLPLQESYSLETLTVTFGIEHKAKHRAYDDAIAAMDLFNILVDKISELKPHTLEKIQKKLAIGKHNLSGLFNEIKSKPQTNPPIPSFVEPAKKELAEVKISPDDFLKIYSATELFAQIFPDYQKREAQELMTQCIIQAFQTPHHYILEAGTGTGKTMAYLLAAAYQSITTGEQVVIATNTKTLQEQIMQKDLPQAQKILQLFLEPQLKGKELNLKAQSLKGRTNYVSLRRFEIFCDRKDLSATEALFAAKILIWLDKTPTGDREEISLYGEEYFFFQEICCQEKACLHDDPKYRQGCYLLKSREIAETSDILIVNHSLLVQDMKLDYALLPSYQNLIIDEAHHLEESVTSAYSNYFSCEYTLKLIEEFKGAVQNAGKDLAGSLFLNEDEIKLIQDTIEQINTLPDKIQIFFSLVGIFYQNLLPQGEQQIILNQYFANTPEWQKILASAQNINESLQESLDVINKTILQEEKPEFSKENFQIQKLITTFNITSEWQKKFANTFKPLPEDQEKQDEVTWVSQNHLMELRVQSAIINVGNLLEEKLYSQKQSVTLLSATLTVNHSFEFLRQRLNLGENFEEMVIPSHFDYPEQVAIVLPENIPAPNHPDYTQACANIIYDAIKQFDGRTLVLFTSQRAIESTYTLIAPKLKAEGFEIYAQNITGSKGKILQKFRGKGEKKAIFGTNTFWEGVDIKGDDIKCVIIQKLPFDPPFDPIHLARGSMYMNSFGEYALPRAIIRFKQGFGRLIRSEEDTGSIVVLDNRITQKDYGKAFLESLPEGITVKQSLN